MKRDADPSMQTSGSASDADGGVTPNADKDDRLAAAVEEYKAAVERGEHPRRAELLARHADIAEELSDCLEMLGFLNAAANELPGAAIRSRDRDPLLTSPTDDQQTQQTLGDFRLLREIGRGGMGIVYEARQLSLGRRVAVKVLPFASSLDPRHLQRFHNEAHAAAQLHHTNIVPVYAVGCERSVHFYAMQFIEGRSLAEVIRELRRASGKETVEAERSEHQSLSGSVRSRQAAGSVGGAIDSRTLSLAPQSRSDSPNVSLRSSKGSSYVQTVARLALQAAEALEYAHSAGVVHRDIKPANLLLDAKGSLWVTDFGLAQCYSESGLTRSGDLLGTLRYMSPEQASGKAVVLDQRTDIYSLGVTIYELLTLERALPGESREELLQQHGTYEPRLPRAIDRSIPLDLQTIITKSIAKDPADRYQTAGALADDLRRFLQDEPILAKPPSLFDRSVKWTRRHKSLTVSAMFMLLVCSIGFFTTTVIVARERDDRDKAYRRELREALVARQERASAAESFAQARAAVGYLSRVAASELAENSASLEVRRQMLEAALDYYQGFFESHRNDPAVKAELTEAQANATQILSDLAVFQRFDIARNRARLLRENPVIKELGLTPNQSSRAWLILDSFDDGAFAEGPEGGRRGGSGPPNPEAHRRRSAAMAQRIDTAIAGVLSAAQVQRLAQIDRQVRAPSSLSDPDVAEALALSREQKELVRKAQSEFRIAMRNIGRPPAPPPPGFDSQPPPPDPRRDKLRQTQYEESLLKVLAALTPSQRDTWRQLTGDALPAAALLNRPMPNFEGPPPVRPGPPPWERGE